MSRESFAARQGWSYAETDPDVLLGWQIGPRARGAESNATRVVRGTYKGWPCAIFDYHWRPGEPAAGSAPPNGGMLATTMFVINIRGVSSRVELQLKPNWWRDRAPQQAGDGDGPQRSHTSRQFPLAPLTAATYGREPPGRADQ
ncbi:MAG: hypothetical protein DLM59_20165 [Pseudonocardiales bacterium]|nr:MAG: hypothetical protein DLM59_20165 [Pseudonocardiales bacterium]